MKVSLDWLKDYIDVKVSPEKLADDLSLFGQEVEDVEKKSDDTIFDIEITPNRGDCLSILGIAREISALYKLKVKNEKLKVEVKSEKLDKDIQVKISNPNICPRFTARIIDGIKIGESPKWIQEKLATYGFRPINNIVDITNYAMIAGGQPLHAFDYDKIGSSEQASVSRKIMDIRQAKKGEEVMTLDGQNRILNEGAIIIEDDQKIYDLAGIMGGIKSEVDENTKTIILQGAIFDPILIRKASKHLNHTTDASYRYERGVDFEGTKAGVDFATKLILDSCKEAKAGELIDEIHEEQKPKSIPFKIGDINQLLGTDVTIDQAEEYLNQLNVKVETKVDDKEAQTIATPPSYRAYDITIWQDIAEEIARMEGYNNLGVSEIEKNPQKIKNKRYILEEVLRDIISGQGYTEVQSYSFADKKLLENLEMFSEKIIEIEKPLSPETQYLRPDLLPSVLSQIAKNPWAPEVKMFEIGNCFEGENEFTQLAIGQTGKNKKELEDVINIIKEKLGVDQISYELCEPDQKVLDLLKIRKKVIAVRIDFEKLLERVGNIAAEFEISDKKIKYKPISKFAPTIRDLAFIVAEDIKASDVAKDIKSISDKILLVELFDEFSSDKFGKGKKNLAYHIWIEDLRKPMEDKEVEQIIKDIIKKISQKYQAKPRV